MGTTGKMLGVAAVAAMTVGALLVGAWRPAGGEEAQQVVNVTIHDYAFKVETRVLRPQAPVRIVLYNTDAVEHGFTAPGLEQMDVRVDAHGVVTFGRGIKGLHVAPGQKAEIIFTPDNSGSLAFSCDLHPKMKGELAVLSLGAA